MPVRIVLKQIIFCMHSYYLTEATEKGSKRREVIEDLSECCLSFKAFSCWGQSEESWWGLRSGWGIPTQEELTVKRERQNRKSISTAQSITNPWRHSLRTPRSDLELYFLSGLAKRGVKLSKDELKGKWEPAWLQCGWGHSKFHCI